MDNIFTLNETTEIGNQIGVNWDKISPEQFELGLMVEFRLGMRSRKAKMTNEDLIEIGRIAHSNINDLSYYYSNPRKRRNSGPKKNNHCSYAVDATNDSIVNAPFTETYQSSFNEERRENNEDLPNK